MGVYRAFDTHLDRPVAVKILRADAASNPECKRRLGLEDERRQVPIRMTLVPRA